MSSRADQAIASVDGTINALFYTADKIYDIINTHQDILREEVCPQDASAKCGQKRTGTVASCSRGNGKSKNVSCTSQSQFLSEMTTEETRTTQHRQDVYSHQYHQGGALKKVAASNPPPPQCRRTSGQLKERAPNHPSTPCPPPDVRRCKDRCRTKQQARTLVSESDSELTTIRQPMVPELLSDKSITGSEVDITLVEERKKMERKEEEERARRMEREKRNERKREEERCVVGERKSPRCCEVKRLNCDWSQVEIPPRKPQHVMGSIEIRSVASIGSETDKLHFVQSQKKVSFGPNESHKLVEFEYAVGTDANGKTMTMPAQLVVYEANEDGWMPMKMAVFKTDGSLLLEMACELNGEKTRKLRLVGSLANE